MPRSERYPDWPSVTEVLSSCGLTREYPDNAATLAARRRGSVLHKAIELHHADRLDIESLDPRVRPYFDGYLRYLDDSGAKIDGSEIEVVSKSLGVVGHIDLVGWGHQLYDVKTAEDVDLRGAKLQLAGYQSLFEEHKRMKASGAFVLQLRRTGGYLMHDVSDNRYAQNIFKAAVMVFYEKGKK